jgi:hypothetical protein
MLFNLQVRPALESKEKEGKWMLETTGGRDFIFSATRKAVCLCFLHVSTTDILCKVKSQSQVCSIPDLQSIQLQPPSGLFVLFVFFCGIKCKALHMLYH